MGCEMDGLVGFGTAVPGGGGSERLRLRKRCFLQAVWFASVVVPVAVCVCHYDGCCG